MINFVTTLALLFLTNLIQAQYKSNCIPQDLIVTGEDVNFRIEPSTNSTPKGKLVNGELLKFIALEPVGQNDGWNNLNDAWIKVKRISTVEEGYVFGKYVKPQEMAYHYSGDCDRIQNGFWYGIYQEGNKVFMVETKPKLQEVDKGYMSIAGNDEKQRILICSQSKLQEGPIEGRFFGQYGESISIGDKVNLLRIKDNSFKLACTGEVDLDRHMGFSRKNEKIYFIKEEIDGSQRHYTNQDLTECIQQFGEVGYTLIFAGDLNNDGIPEVIFSEATTRESAMYYFMSNPDGKLELKSVSYSSSKC